MKKEITLSDVKNLIEMNYQKIDEKIDNLAIMISKGFEGIDRRFEQVDRRFEQIDKRFVQIDKHFERIDVRLDLI